MSHGVSVMSLLARSREGGRGVLGVECQYL